MYFKMGFHVGAGGNMTGIGDYFKKLDADGAPAVLVSADNYGPCHELAQIAESSNVNHVIAYRLTTKGQNDGRDYDTPSYPLDPVIAAGNYWQMTRAKLPPEFNKEKVWIIACNEVDKNQADWLGYFGEHLIELAVGDGYKIALFGWSCGEPEYEHWKTQGMLECLQACADYSPYAAIALHEYSFNVGNIQNGYPYQIGRYGQLFSVCDEFIMLRPQVLISEWGWTYNDAPGVNQALQDIQWANTFVYQPYEILGAATWYLGAGYNNIANKVQPLIAPVTQMAIDYVPTTPDPDPDPEPTLEEALWDDSVNEQIQRGIPLNPNAGLQSQIFKDGLVPVHREITPTIGGEAYTIQAAESLDGNTPRRVYVWHGGQPVWWFGDPAIQQPAGFSFKAWPTDYMVITQRFGANPDYYRQFGLPGHEGLDIRAPMGSGIYAVDAGEVFEVKTADGHNYGTRVRIRHADGYVTVYAHLQTTLVHVGDKVKAGQKIGEANATGNSIGGASHLHITLKNDRAVPGDQMYIGYPYNIVDPEPFVRAAWNPVWPGNESLIDLLDYLRGDGRLYEVRHSTGNQERFQTQLDANGWYQTKNSQWEEFWVDGDYIIRGTDTSPGKGRYYTLRQNGRYGAQWCKRYMMVGDVYTGPSHHVQFYNKADCSTSIPNSGNATMTTKLVANHVAITFPKPDGLITMYDVVEMFTQTGETMYFAKGFGLVGWKSSWGESYISEIHAPGTRPDNVREVIPCLSKE